MLRSLSRRIPSALALALLVCGALPLLTACADSALTPAAPPATPPAAKGGRVLGVIAVTFSGIGTSDVRASAHQITPPGVPLERPAAPGLHLNLSPLPSSSGSIELDPISTGSFTDGDRTNGGVRYMSATFRVRNAQADSTPYADARTNLTFLAVQTPNSISGTAISEMDRFDGTPAEPTIATQILPTGHVFRDQDGQLALVSADVLQVITEAEAASFIAPAGVTSVLPYGFMVRNPTTPSSRALPANPADNEFDGVVTFAFKVPLQASAADDPFTVTATFQAVDDDDTRVTQSVAAQTAAGVAAVEARAAALGASSLTLLPTGNAWLGSGVRVVCTVRVAGDAGSPTATLDLPSGSTPWLVPAPLPARAFALPRTARIAVGRCPDIPVADTSTFVVHGFESPWAPAGSYAGAGSSLAVAPAPDVPSGHYFPGEEVEVTLKTALGLATPVVARYRVAASGGSGTFLSGGLLGAGNSPISIATADFDGDGGLDLAVANFDDNTVSILRNDGSGNFTDAGSPAVGAGPISVAAADLDGDGDIDLVAANQNDNTVSILLNNGSGSFTAASSLIVGISPASVAVADLDGDGDIDLAVADDGGGTVSILRNDGSGSFTSAGSSAVGGGPLSVAAADLDGDGDIDLVAANQNDNTVSILLNNGSGSFTSAGAATVGSDPVVVAAADLDSDGDIDLAVTNHGGNTVSILRNDGSGSFTAAGSPTVGTGPDPMATADLDGDGDIDLAVMNDGGFTVLLNDGSGSFTGANIEVPDATLLPVAAGDLDGDGDIDLAVADNNSTIVTILTNNNS